MVTNRFHSWQMVDLGLLISGICKRPKMYTSNSDLYTVATYIDGFIHANEATYNEMSDFNKWLAEKLEFPQNWNWWAGLKRKYPNDKEALEELPKLFQEFRQSHLIL